MTIRIFKKFKAVNRYIFVKTKGLRILGLTILSLTVITLFLRWIALEYSQAIMLLWLAIIIALFAALINGHWTRQSLALTRQSLELVRQSTRAFLSVYDVRYAPTPSSSPRLLLSIRNTGILPAHNIIVENELIIGDGKHGPRQRKEQPTLKPDEIGEVIFTLPPSVRDMIPTEKTLLIIRTEWYPDVSGTKYFYHTDRHYSVPPNIETLNNAFEFVLRSGGAFD